MTPSLLGPVIRRPDTSPAPRVGWADSGEGWVARYAAPGDTPAGRLTSTIVLSAEFPGGAVVNLPGPRRPAGWLCSAESDLVGDQVHTVHVNMPDVPRLWYVELREPDAVPAACTLIAYSDTRYDGGRVLTEAEAVDGRVTGDRQVAAIRWLTDTGLGHQVYVQPAARRRGIAGKLAVVAYTVQFLRGLPTLRADGRRTDDGEAWLSGLPPVFAELFAPRTHVMPDMTPGGR